MPYVDDECTISSPTDDDGYFVWEVNSYDRDAPIPGVGSRWVWEPDVPHARDDIVVTEALWHSAEWWVTTVGRRSGTCWNDVGRFWQACAPATRD